MIRLSITAGLLTADFTPGEPVPEGEPNNLIEEVIKGMGREQFEEWQARTAAQVFLDAFGDATREAVASGHGATPAETLPPEDTGSATLPPACKCELLEEPGTHPTCDVFWASVLHADLCITCYHEKNCHS